MSGKVSDVFTDMLFVLWVCCEGNIKHKKVCISVTRWLDYLFNVLAMYNNEDLPNGKKCTEVD